MICSACRQDLPKEYFAKNISKASGFSTYCKECKRVKDVEYYNNNLIRRKQIRERGAVAIQATKEIVLNYLKEHPCGACGFSDIRALEFHHIDPQQKEIEISKLKGCSISTLKKEMNKCVILCANCHRILHASIAQLNRAGSHELQGWRFKSS